MASYTDSYGNVVYDQYAGLDAYQQENVRQGLPPNWQGHMSAKPISVTIEGSRYGTGQPTIEGAKEYLYGQQSRTGLTEAQIDKALSGITGAFPTRSAATADLQSRLNPLSYSPITYQDNLRSALYQDPTSGQYQGQSQVISSATDNPLSNLFSMFGIADPSVATTQSIPASVSPTPGITIEPNQTQFHVDATGVSLVIPNLGTIKIPKQASTFRSQIGPLLKKRGVSEASIAMVLAEYDLTRVGQSESPATETGQEVSESFAGLSDQIKALLAGSDDPTQGLRAIFDALLSPDTTTTQAWQASMDPTSISNILGMFGTTGEGAATSDYWTSMLQNFEKAMLALNPDQATEQAVAGTPASLVPGGTVKADIPGLRPSDTPIYEGFTGLPFGGPYSIPSVDTALINTSDLPAEQRPVGDFVNAVTGNATGASDMLAFAKLNLFGTPKEGDTKALFESLFGTNFTFESIKDRYLTKGPNYDPEAALYLSQALGQQNLGIFNTLLTTAENERQFNAAMLEFTERLKVDKQSNQITVLNKMMDMTLGQMQLNQTAETNIMNAQIAAMELALKSKELTQGEQASIRGNLLDAVGLELQNKRIDNEQANFLTTMLLQTNELALRVRELDQRGDIAEADRELEREGMALTQQLGLADITAGMLGRQAELQFGREGLAQERELGFATIGQREREASMNAQVALLNSAMANPYSFAALSSLGGIPGMPGSAAPAAAAVAPTQMFPGLGGLGFQIPQTARAGAMTPAPQFFTGGMPTVGALNQLDPASMQYLQNVLAFSGTAPEGLGRLAGEFTPAAGGFPGRGRTVPRPI